MVERAASFPRDSAAPFLGALLSAAQYATISASRVSPPTLPSGQPNVWCSALRSDEAVTCAECWSLCASFLSFAGRPVMMHASRARDSFAARASETGTAPAATGAAPPPPASTSAIGEGVSEMHDPKLTRAALR
jgi:hypothetical protein